MEKQPESGPNFADALQVEIDRYRGVIIKDMNLLANTEEDFDV